MLQDGPSLFALTAAGDLVSVIDGLRESVFFGLHEQIALGTPLEAKERLEPLERRDRLWTEVNRNALPVSERAEQCVAERLVHRQVQRVRVALVAARRWQRETVGQFAIVNDRAAAAVPPYDGAVSAFSV